MKFSSFPNTQHSFDHSLHTLNLLYEYDDFMESVGTVADLGCGQSGSVLEWWATRTTRGEEQIPLDIQCTGFDLVDKLKVKHKNISYQKQNIELLDSSKRKYDVLWCHDTFQYLLNPLGCLKNWRNIANNDSMLILSIPQTTNIKFNQQEFNVPSGQYYHYTLTNLIYMLAVNSWDCRNGFFKINHEDQWIHAIVYKSDVESMDPAATSWYDLVEKSLLPDSVEASINKYGYPRQPDLVLPWLDKSVSWMAQL